MLRNEQKYRPKLRDLESHTAFLSVYLRMLCEHFTNTLAEYDKPNLTVGKIDFVEVFDSLHVILFQTSLDKSTMHRSCMSKNGQGIAHGSLCIATLSLEPQLLLKVSLVPL